MTDYQIVSKPNLTELVAEVKVQAGLGWEADSNPNPPKSSTTEAFQWTQSMFKN